MNAGKISHLRLEDGRELSGKMFINASYEGDLLPGAGVSFTVGREANATYNHRCQGGCPRSGSGCFQCGVHPNAEGIGKVTFPLLQWKLSGGLPLP